MKYNVLGNRIPYEYFITSGKGESDAGSAGLPYETGSYDAALNDAGIQNANVIEYTSVIPPESIQIPKNNGLKRIHWGEVLECIKAQANGIQGSFISAAVMVTTINDPNGKYLGGFAVEYSGSGNKNDCENSLMESIIDMIKRRGYGTIDKPTIYKNNITSKGYTVHPGKIFVYDSLRVSKQHGTVFTAICFCSHIYPTEIYKNNSPKHFLNDKKKSKKNKTRKIKF